MRLSEKGILVFAGVRKDQDAEALQNECKYPENVVPFIADVSDEEQLLKAAEVIKGELEKSDKKLLALVNNAGYGYYSPIETASQKKMRTMFNANVFGLVSVTQAFLPLLREYGLKTGLKNKNN